SPTRRSSTISARSRRSARATGPSMAKRSRRSARRLRAFGLQPRPEHLRDAPRLGDAAARREGLLGVEDFADRPDARLHLVMLEAGEAFARTGQVARIDPQIGVDVRP